MERATQYLEEEKYEEAIVESMNVLKIDRTNPTAIRNIAIANTRLGNLRAAFPFLMKTVELMPEDHEMRLTLGTLFKRAGHHEKAREQAVAVLELVPTNIPALFMLVETVTTTNEASETLALLTKQSSKLEKNPYFHIAVGNLRMRSGNLEETKSSFMKARTVDPESHAASLSLAALHTAEGERDKAAEEYEKALAQAPENNLIRIKWADFEIRRGNMEPARKILDEIGEDAPAWVLSLFHLARIEMAEKNIDKCIELLDTALEKKKDYADAAFMKASAKLLKGETGEAIEIYEELLRKNPRALAVRYRLALALIAKGKTTEAIAELERTTSAAPGYADAVQLLAELNIRKRNPDPAIESLQPLVKRRPDLKRAHMLLAAAYQSKGLHDKAETACRTAIGLAPDDLRAHYLLGQILLTRKDTEGARKELTTALEISPRFTPALIQLVMLTLREEKGEEAVALLTDHMERFPDDSNAMLLLGKTYLVMGDNDRAEESLLKAVEIQPRLVGAYVTLSRLYASTGKIDSALAKLEESRKVNPDNPSTLMLEALLFQRQGNTGKAIEFYEKIIAASPKFVAAVNNLAYLYSSNPETMDRAYELARNAHETLPEDPYVADTFGWILFLRGEYKWALSVLEEHKDSLSDTPEALYHLGMVRYALGHEQGAGAALRNAIEQDTEFEGIEKARLSLEAMDITPNRQSADAALAQIDSMLKTDPVNLAATAKRAALLELTGKPKEALAAHRKALEISPVFTPALIGIARLNADHFNDIEKAMEAASKAKELSPDDPRISGLLGWISFLKGNHEWALGLLRESASSLPDDSQTLYRLGMACYSQGDIASATKHVQRALTTGRELPNRDDARRFLKMIELYRSAETLGDVPAEVTGALEAKPEYVPALMVAGTVNMLKGRREEAIAQFETVQEQYPGFAQAGARLAELYSSDEQMKKRAHELAAAARVALPKDARLARTLGILLFEQGDHEYASALLQESIAELPSDGRAHYYLGMCRYGLGDKQAATQSLRLSVELSPDAPYVQKAKEVIAELTEPAD